MSDGAADYLQTRIRVHVATEMSASQHGATAAFGKSPRTALGRYRAFTGFESRRSVAVSIALPMGVWQ
jgi:hypothetical protein